MLLSLPTRNTTDNHDLTFSLPYQDTKHKRRSFWRSGCSPFKSSSLGRKRSIPPLNDSSSVTSISFDSDSDSYPNSRNSSFTQLSDTDTFISPEPTSPANHPPAHVFGKSDQGYSMFYLKLPNGNWMVRCRTADRKIIATYEVDGSMI